LWPQRARVLISVGGYNVLNVAANAKPLAPAQEHRLWYQCRDIACGTNVLRHRTRAGLAANGREFCKLLWRLWSPNWRIDDATYERTAASFDNPDFVDVVIHSYRHRFGWAPGDPSLEPIEERLAAMPRIGVPTLVLHGGSDGVAPGESSEGHARFFSGPYVRRVIPDAGHFLAREAPDAIIQAVRELVPKPN
jgi:pimeloyl-ACP methyl ester carboxylesterase